MNNPSQSSLYQVEPEERNASPPQAHKSNSVSVFLIFASVFIAGGTVLWILNVLNIISGPWSNVFGAGFTGISIIIALLALHPARRD